MFSHQFNPDITPGDIVARPKFKQSPMPTKAELLARCSFPSVNQNKYLTRMIRSGK
ncbi:MULTISPECIES: DUF2737 family protein [unclassified Cedecea]|uniref:DUF2737 family protein n=1 Tax=unclassified Cedecea TaxID=2649846 RepID=UPI00301AAC02